MLDAIADPVTGQTIVFRERSHRRVAGELLVQPDGFVPPHVHASQWERFEGAAGELRFRVGLRRRTLGSGDVLVVPPGTVHGFRNCGPATARFLIELSPPRRGEEGLRALFGLQRDGRVRISRFGARPLLQVAVLFDEYLDEVHLPLVPFAVQRIAFRALARLGRRRGYRSTFPEYARPQSSDGWVEQPHGCSTPDIGPTAAPRSRRGTPAPAAYPAGRRRPSRSRRDRR